WSCMSFPIPSPENHYGGFGSTHWSVVLQSGAGDSPQADAALAQLCQTYWYPLYLFVRRSGNSAEDAQDLTQAFFARLMEKNYLAAADPAKGKFRSFLLVALKRFLANEWDRARTQKRGGDCRIISLDAEHRYASEPASALNPEQLFERRWALTLLENVLAKVKAEQAEAGRAAIFEALQPFLTSSGRGTPYAELAKQLAMTEGG